MPYWLKENINLRRKGRTDKEKKENIWPMEEKKNRKERKYLDTENIWSTEEKKNEEGKGGKHLEKENAFMRRKNCSRVQEHATKRATRRPTSKQTSKL